MPLYEVLDGIMIKVFPNEHVPPHIHASIGEYESRIDIKKVSEIVADLPLPKKHLRKALKYVQDNQEELLEEFYNLNPAIKKI